MNALMNIYTYNYCDTTYKCVFGLVWFYGISTIIGYLMPKLIYANILNIYDL